MRTSSNANHHYYARCPLVRTGPSLVLQVYPMENPDLPQLLNIIPLGSQVRTGVCGRAGACACDLLDEASGADVRC